ncbi:MAG: hypothetical protein LBS12_00820 [Prevotellaceae bacterium]|jgi:hypothetical protein|nr:hypothetical protein [Prevotellaceae bacterium]
MATKAQKPIKTPAKPATTPAKPAAKPAKSRKTPAKSPAAPPLPPAKTPERTVYTSEGKRRIAISQKNLSQELQDVMKERFPRGYADYMDKIMKVDKADGTFFYAITLEVEDAIYLVKIEVPIDTDYDEVEKKLFGGGHEVDDDGNEIPDSEEEKDYAGDDVADEE